MEQPLLFQTMTEKPQRIEVTQNSAHTLHPSEDALIVTNSGQDIATSIRTTALSEKFKSKIVHNLALNRTLVTPERMDSICAGIFVRVVLREGTYLIREKS